MKSIASARLVAVLATTLIVTLSGCAVVPIGPPVYIGVHAQGGYGYGYGGGYHGGGRGYWGR